MKEIIKEILECKFDYYRPNEDLLITLIDFDNEYEEIVKGLNDIEIEVLTLYSYTYDTFQEIADHIGFSKQYIQSCYQRAINKIINNLQS